MTHKWQIKNCEEKILKEIRVLRKILDHAYQTICKVQMKQHPEWQDKIDNDEVDFLRGN